MMIRVYLIHLFLGLATAGAATNNAAPALPVEPITPQALQEEIRTSEAPLLMVHAWATWCAPCREEFPELLAVYGDYADEGLVLLLVSADEPDEIEPVRAFLRKMNSPVGSRITTELSPAFINTLSPDWRGALPATWLFRNGERVEGWEGKRSREAYEQTLDRLLKRKETHHD